VAALLEGTCAAEVSCAPEPFTRAFASRAHELRKVALASNRATQESLAQQQVESAADPGAATAAAMGSEPAPASGPGVAPRSKSASISARGSARNFPQDIELVSGANDRPSTGPSGSQLPPSGGHKDASGAEAEGAGPGSGSEANSPSSALTALPPPPAPPPEWQPLAEGWAKHQDEGSGRAYYYRAATGETRWDRPLVAVAVAVAVAAAPPHAAVPPPSPPPPPAGSFGPGGVDS
jgi:hypothetical protein